MRTNLKYQRGRVSRAAVLLVILLMGLMLIVGFWYGRHPRALSESEEKAPELFHRPRPRALPRFNEKSPLKGRDQDSLLEDRIADASAQSMPSVVNVFSEKKVQVSQQMPDLFNTPFFHQFFGPMPRGIPRERSEKSLGSGVIVTPDGYILTNNHVVANADSIKVALPDKRQLQAKVIGTDPQSDLAVIKIDAKDLPAIALGDSDKLRVGQIVIAIGNPFGLSQSVSMGIISATGRSHVGITDYEDFIQTDAAINPGNSGGALVDLDGELVGINTAIFSRSGGYMGIGFAIPVNMAKQIMRELIEKGSVQRGWLGVSIQDLTPELAQQFGIEGNKGALVSEVFPGAPAAKAGLEAGDVIVSVGGQEVDDATDLRNTVAGLQPGSDTELVVIRDGDKKSIEMKLGQRPENPEEASAGPGETMPEHSGKARAAGMTVTNLAPAIADQLGVESDVAGVVVTDVEPGSRADRANVQVGDIIFRIDRKPVKNTADFAEAVRAVQGGPLLLHVRRDRGNLFLVVPK